MKITAVANILALVSSLTSANPSSGSNKVIAPPFLLKTVAVNGTKYDGMYVVPAHTFAGGNVAGIFKGSRDAIPSYLENSALYFKFGKQKYDQYPFALYYTDYAAAFYEGTIDIGSKPIKGFSLTKDNLLVTDYFGSLHELKRDYDREFHGAFWRVCDWSHGYPELFLNNPQTSNNADPSLVTSNCGLVNLKAVHQ